MTEATVPRSFDDAPIRLAEALAIIAETYKAVTGTEAVALKAAHGRILAQDIVAPMAVPPADNSALDGYAFRHADLRTGLRIIGTAAAGHPFQRTVQPGEAVRIFTGAVMPAGTDTVVGQEDVATDGVKVTISAGLRPGDNRRLAGEDIAIGDRVLSAGQRLGPAAVGLLASIGIAMVDVCKAPKVAVFSTGDELSEKPAVLAAGTIHDSNRPVLLAMLAGMGIATTDLGILPDSRDMIGTRLSEAAETHDAVICSGGMSVGDEDHVKSAVASLGALDFWSVAIKPGRPVAVGHIAETPFFGLPGNPVAMIVTFTMIVRPALLRLCGAEAEEPRRFPVIADFALVRKAGKREFLRCTLHDVDGRLLARKFGRGGAGVLSSVAGSEGFLELAESIGAIEPGMALPFIPFSALGL